MISLFCSVEFQIEFCHLDVVYTILKRCLLNNNIPTEIVLQVLVKIIWNTKPNKYSKVRKQKKGKETHGMHMFFFRLSCYYLIYKSYNFKSYGYLNRFNSFLFNNIFSTQLFSFRYLNSNSLPRPYITHIHALQFSIFRQRNFGSF